MSPREFLVTFIACIATCIALAALLRIIFPPREYRTGYRVLCPGAITQNPWPYLSTRYTLAFVPMGRGGRANINNYNLLVLGVF